MILSTTFDVPGRTIAQNLGVARGNVVRGRSIGRNIVASFRMLVGGE
ncbi:MAG: heavy metal-binding domain-containing protein, partial [Proteobacteria bacterium]|nr:heavy metal-binding domain-containing protein [Pseudomonadota bacterium]